MSEKEGLSSARQGGWMTMPASVRNPSARVPTSIGCAQRKRKETKTSSGTATPQAMARRAKTVPLDPRKFLQKPQGREREQQQLVVVTEQTTNQLACQAIVMRRAEVDHKRAAALSKTRHTERQALKSAQQRLGKHEINKKLAFQWQPPLSVLFRS